MRINIEGFWNYKEDREDVGIKENWYEKLLVENLIKLPGTTAEANIGDPIEIEAKMSKEAVNRLREHYSYLGAMWYQKTIFIPYEAKDKEVYLYLERSMLETMVWIGDDFVGSFDSLSVPHKFRITDFVEPGKDHKVTIRIDNRDKYDIKDYSSAYTPQTQTLWNGVVGELAIDLKDKTNFEKVKIIPKISEKSIVVEANINNYSDAEDYKLLIQVSGSEEKLMKVNLHNKNNIIKCIYKINENIELWNEHNPYLYKLTCKLLKGSTIVDKKVMEFGMREISTEGRHILLNGERIFLRGTLDCCIYPLTGYPPTNVSEWERIFKIVKSYGLNHVRFHSWCPPEGAFKAADKVGIYVQAEGPIWLDDYFCPVGEYKGHYEYFPKEAKRIVEEYANHPSFIIFSNGNEIKGDFNLLNNIVKELKEDKRLLYTLTTNWDRKVYDGDDVFIAQSFDEVGVRGQYFLNEMVETFKLNFDEAVSKRTLPTLSHEVGQYSVYPDIREIYKYNGALRAINLEAIKNDLEEKELIKDIDKFVTASGKLALNLYKDDIEAALKTRDLSGVQLLDLHDFPGQSTATVGILNAFWESKGLIEPEEFKGFFGPVVPLIISEKRIYSNTEEFKFNIQISNYLNVDLSSKKINYKLKNKNSIIHSGCIESIDLKKNFLTNIDKEIIIRLDSIKENSMLKLEISIDGTEYKNTWKIWVYNGVKENKLQYVTSKDKLIKAVDNNENVVLILNSENMKVPRQNKYFSVFWSPVHFETKDPNGMYVDYNNELLKDFPTEEFGDYQWKSLVESSQIINTKDINNKIVNIAQMVPNFYSNEAMSILFATKIKESIVIVTSIDFINIEEKSIEAKALYTSIESNFNTLKIEKSVEIQEILELMK